MDNWFKDMSEHGTLHLGNTLHMECLWLCFEKILQEDLDKVRDHWNSHKITKSVHSTVTGIPDVMYFLPEYYSLKECLVKVSEQEASEMEQHCEQESEDEDAIVYQEYFEYILETEGLNYPSTVEEALNIFQMVVNLNK